MERVNGVDVYIGDGQINWYNVANDNIKFAMIKATQGYSINNPKSGKFTDRMFVNNINMATANNIVCGTYHYLMAKTVKEAEEEAKYFVEVISPYKSKIQLYACVDIENDKAKTYSKSEKALNTDILIAFCEIVNKAGFKAGIYTNPNFIKNYLEFDRLSSYTIWLAYWTDEQTMNNFVNSFKNKDQFKIWQYGSTTVDGINDKTDGDKLLFDISELYKYKVITDNITLDKAKLIESIAKSENIKCSIYKEMN